MRCANWAAIAATIVGTLVLILGIVMGWYGFPLIVDNQIAENVVLRKGTEQFDRFEELPIPLDFKIYIFNIENPNEVNSGEKPIVKEVGPYVYKQSRHKENITFDGDKEISYYEYLKFEYDQEQSGKLLENDTITVLNPALNGAIQIMELVGLSTLLPALNDTAEITFGTNNIFLETTVGEFLFDGYNICNFDQIDALGLDVKRELWAKLVCLGVLVLPLKSIKPTRTIIDEKTDEKERKLVFSFLAHKKDNHDGHYTIKSGTQNVLDVAEIVAWEDKKTIQSWAGGPSSWCNKVRGRDAVIYPPHITNKDTLTVFNTDICRTVDLHYKQDVEFRDVTALEFRLSEYMFDAVQENNKDEMCYCLKVSKGITQKNGCMKSGLLEIFTCYNAPILLSYPHFLWADKVYKEAVQGTRPVVEKHKTFALLEPNTGTPLGGAKRVQFNMFVRDVQVDGKNVIDFLKDYQQTRLIPVLWLEESFTITDKLYDKLYEQYISKTYLITWVTWGIIGFGIGIVVITLVVVLVLRLCSKKETV